MTSKIFNEDCIGYMKTLSYEHYGLAISDPNYGIGESSKNHASRNTPVKQRNGEVMRAPRTTYKKKNWDDVPPPDEYFAELYRTTKNQIIWGANYFKQIVEEPFKPPRREHWKEFIATNPTGWIIWDKCNGTNDFNDCELAWTSFDRPTYILPYMWNGMMQGKSITEFDIAQGNKKLNEKRIHPTQKPVLLYRKLLIEYGIPGMSVFDSHAGSQSLRVAAHMEGWDYSGCEIDKEIFQSGSKRFGEEFSKQEIQYPSIVGPNAQGSVATDAQSGKTKLSTKNSLFL